MLDKFSKKMTAQPSTVNDARSTLQHAQGGNQPTFALPRKYTANSKNNRPYNEVVRGSFRSNTNCDFPSLPLNRSAGGSGDFSNDVDREEVDRLLFDEPQRIFGVDLFEFMKKVAEFGQYYKNLKSLYDQQCAYIKFIRQMTNRGNNE